MSTRFEFDEAAKLYATNARIVERMQQACETDIDRLLDALYHVILNCVSPRNMHEKGTGKTRYWWLADDDAGARDHAYVWIWGGDVAIVRPGEIHATANTWAGGPLTKHRPQFRAVRDELQLTSACQTTAGEGGGLFTLVVKYGDTDPLAAATKPIADLLIALYNAEQSITKQRLNEPGRPSATQTQAF